MRRLAVAAGLLLGASACASPPPPAAPAPQPPPRAAVAATPVTPPAAVSADACGAAPLQNLIGRPRAEAPVPLHPDRERVACTTCPITEDYRPERLNIFFDAETGIIRQVRCG